MVECTDKEHLKVREWRNKKKERKSGKERSTNMKQKVPPCIKTRCQKTKLNIKHNHDVLLGICLLFRQLTKCHGA